MTLTLPLQPDEEAKLFAIARAKGVSTDALIRDAIEKILANAPELESQGEPTRSSRGNLASYVHVTSPEEIDHNRPEMFAYFARD
jgi:hypothetical protein